MKKFHIYATSMFPLCIIDLASFFHRLGIKILNKFLDKTIVLNALIFTPQKNVLRQNYCFFPPYLSQLKHS